MTQVELNKQLYTAVTASMIDLLYIEKLLKLGADPLGTYDENDADCFVLDELFADSQDEKVAERLPDIIGLFLNNGMDIDRSEFDVLYCLTWIRNEFGIQTLKLFLDNALSVGYAESFFDHMYGDILQFEIPEAMEMEDSQKPVEYAVKMVLLSASYDRIIKNSKYIRDLIEVENNDTTILKRFRKWNDYHCKFFIQRSTKHFECYVDVLDINTNCVIWSFQLK